MKQIKLLLILCVLILLASCRTTESTNSLNITSESKDISSGKEFVSSQPILKDNVNLSMSVFKGVTSIFSEDVINSAFKLSENKITQYGVGPKESGYIITDQECYEFLAERFRNPFLKMLTVRARHFRYDKSHAYGSAPCSCVLRSPDR